MLAFHVRRMPPEGTEPAPAEPLDDEAYTNILAYLLSANEIAAGEAALPADTASLRRFRVPTRPGQELDPFAPVTASRRQQALLANLPPVSSEMLRQPPAESWLHWGRTLDGQNNTPLATIDRGSVQRLQTAWRAPLRPGLSMSMPLVHAGVLFLHAFPDTVLALDASNGEVLWRYAHEPTTGSSQKMGLALSGHKVLVPTSDLHVLALDMRTGALLWDHAIDVDLPPDARAGHQLRSAPLVAGDRVIQGVTASFASRGGFLVGLELDSGEEVWRFNTIARPGEPGGDSWNQVPLDRRSGGSVWHQGTWDPELDLVYYGVAPTYDTRPLLHPVDAPGVSNAALYTNCTIALRPKTGELVWHYQHMANDQWDLDWVFERQIVTVPWKGEDRKVVMNVGKMAILEALDARTGEYLFSVDAGTQNVITAIDRVTGAKTIDTEKMPDPQRPTTVCPSAGGARAWPPTSYSPETRYSYLPITEWCMELGQRGARLLSSGVGIAWADHPDAADGTMGRIQAIDVAYREPAWSHDQVAPISTGLLATGGGLLFAGDLEPSLMALDQRTGEVLWRHPLDASPTSTVISYAIGDKQYVAVLAGVSNLHLAAMEGPYRALVAGLAQREEAASRPEAPAPNGGAALWVFALAPEAEP